MLLSGGDRPTRRVAESNKATIEGTLPCEPSGDDRAGMNEGRFNGSGLPDESGRGVRRPARSADNPGGRIGLVQEDLCPSQWAVGNRWRQRLSRKQTGQPRLQMSRH